MLSIKDYLFSVIVDHAIIITDNARYIVHRIVAAEIKLYDT